MSRQPPVASPVDYDAWSRGYMPPSEHVLIDALQFRGARVVSMASTGKSSWWFVVQGGTLSKAQRKALQMMLLDLDLEDQEAPPPAENSADGDTGSEAQAEHREPEGRERS